MRALFFHHLAAAFGSVASLRRCVAGATVLADDQERIRGSDAFIDELSDAMLNDIGVVRTRPADDASPCVEMMLRGAPPW